MSPQPPLGWNPPVPGACAPCWAGRPRSPAPAHPAGLGAHSPLRLRTPTRGGPSRPGDCLLTQPQGPRVDVHGGAAQGCRPGRTSPWGKGGKPPPQPPCPSPSRPMGELRPAARFWALGPSTCPVPGSHRRASMPMTLAVGVYWKLKQWGNQLRPQTRGAYALRPGGYHRKGLPRPRGTPTRVICSRNLACACPPGDRSQAAGPSRPRLLCPARWRGPHHALACARRPATTAIIAEAPQASPFSLQEALPAGSAPGYGA